LGYYHLHGIVLMSRDIRETDVEVTAFTKERGRTRFVVRGTKKAASSLRGAVEPITEGRFFIVERRGTDLLSEWEPVEFFFGIKRDLEKLSYASYFLRFAAEMMSEHAAEKPLYNLLKNTILLLQTKKDHDIIKLLFEWGFLQGVGQAPDFGVCAGCGEPFESGYWDIEEGEVLCGRCVGMRRMNCAVLSDEAVKLGKRIISGSEYLSRNEFEGRDELDGFEKNILFNQAKWRRGLSPFSRAVARFCRYHLREDIPDWLIRLDK
jgi:DNA repair protein RecO